jgi:tRNA pseudouridine38-40 synthase
VGFFVMRIKLTVAYDGTDFRGWAQNKGQRTVHCTLKEAVRRISGEEIEITGASRTDGGAHAKGQVCHFDCDIDMPPERWAYALNRALPSDLAVMKSQRVSDSFHSRFSVVDRFYRYRILTGHRDPMRERFAFHYGKRMDLDLELMKQAAVMLTGEHDFRAYTEELESSVLNTVRELYRVDVRQVRDEVWVDVVGTAFLRGMMRRMSGAIFEVGRGYRDVVEVSRLLQPEERLKYQWPVVLPAKGLCLMKIRYGRTPRDNRESSNSFNQESKF